MNTYLQRTRGRGDAELLAIILRTGVQGHSALDIARAVVNKFGTFRELSQTQACDLTNFKGLGQAKIAQIRAGFQVGEKN